MAPMAGGGKKEEGGRVTVGGSWPGGRGAAAIGLRQELECE